jgi:glycosyltransferase involved in cell wall biosynthesis
MLTYGTHENDSRVDRAAKTLTEAGHEVLLLAKHRFGLPVVDERDGYTILRSQWDGRMDPALIAADGLRASRRIDLIARDKVARWFRARSPEGWPWEPRPRHRPLTSFERRQRGYLAFANTAFEVARRFRPDIIHAHDFNTLVGAGLISRVMGTPFVYDTHELWVHRNRGDVPYTKREIRWEESFERQAMRRAVSSVTVCDSIADYLARRYSIERPVVVRNIPERREQLPDETLHLRKELGLPDEAFLAVYVGRFTSNRGITDILRALPHADPRIHVAMLGYFDRRFAIEYDKLVDELGVEDRIQTFGPVPSSKVSDWIREADISLTTMNRICLSYTYTLPNKLFESIHAGLPILGPDSPEIIEIIRQYDCGVTYRDGDHVDLASRLNSLASDPSRVAELRQGAQAAAADLRWETERQRLIDAYRDLGAVQSAATASG